MNGPGEGIAQARGAASKGLSGAAKAQSTARKAQAVGGKEVLLLVLCVLIGLVCGALSLLDPFAESAISIPHAMLFISGLVALLLGIWVSAWLGTRFEGDRRFWTEFSIAVLVSLCLGAGLAIDHFFLPGIVGREDPTYFGWVVAPSCVMVLLPLLLLWAFHAAISFEPKRYPLWVYPKNYREQQHAWSRDRIVIANFHFKRKEQEDIITTVNVKLPEDAELGELAYLFIKDYNENRFPNAPITGLRLDDGSLGWVFRKPRYLLRKQRRLAWTQDMLDPKMTIAQNRITRDSDVYFERVFQETGEA